MLQVARLAPNVLAEASDRVADFLIEQLNDDGGARDRAGESDLYYTVFLLEGLIALQRSLPEDRVRRYLRAFGDGDGLDLVHLTCLCRCWAALGRNAIDPNVAAAIGVRLESFRTPDGAYGASVGDETGTVYHTFLAFGARQDLGTVVVQTPDPALAEAVRRLQLEDGGFANQPDVPMATTPTTAAGVTLLRHLGVAPEHPAAPWLLARAHPEGGFRATADAPMPDLLSTATALHALAGEEAAVRALKEPTLDFIDTLWTGRSFCGNWADDEQDCEYTYYALLALGHLSVV